MIVPLLILFALHQVTMSLKIAIPMSLASTSSFYSMPWLANATVEAALRKVNISASVFWIDTKDDPETAMGATVDAVKSHQADVFIGPPDLKSMKMVGYVASYWNVSMVTWTPMWSDTLSVNTEGLLTNLYSSYEHLLGAVATLLIRRNWKHIGYIGTASESCNNFITAAAVVFPGFGIEIESSNEVQIGGSLLASLQALKSQVTIILSCIHLHHHNDFLDSLNKAGMGSGSHVILNYQSDPFVYGESTVHQHNTNYDSLNLSRCVLHLVNYHVPFDKLLSLYKSMGNAMHHRSRRDLPHEKLEYREYLPFLYDAVIIGVRYQNAASKSSSFTDPDLLTGPVVYNGSVRSSRLSVMHYQYNTTEEVFRVSEDGQLHVVQDLHWPWGQLPDDEVSPNSQGNRNGVIFGAVFGTFSAVCLLFFTALVLRKYMIKRKASMFWKINPQDLKMRRTRNNPSAKDTNKRKLIRMETRGTLGFGSTTSLDRNMLFAPIGNYKGTVVAVKTLRFKPARIPAELVQHFKTVKELQHDNINSFIGASLDPSHCYLLYKYCNKGSLQDVLENDDISLDWMFKMSFAIDLSKGMEYLHKSPLRSHGNLKSSNCVIDSRWVLKITDFGAVTPQPKGPDDDIGEHEYYNRLLWMAPELLRLERRPPKGTQKGDVYSFGIIFQEIHLRCTPYYYNDNISKEHIQRVKERCDTPYRPAMSEDCDIIEKAVTLMTSCWSEQPDLRPDFRTIRRKLIDLSGGKKTSILDNMLQMLEAYSNNLEQLVADRTEELAHVKQKTERLLYQMLPPSVANRLRMGQPVIPETFEEVSIFFSDIVGFTNIASKSQPLEVVDLLNDLYTTFDEIISLHDVYKVETIGDAYMCVSGLPKRNGKKHSGEIANMALDLISAVTSFRIRHVPEEQLQLRVGLHTGSCAAGVVGLTMPRYCLFGDTVNVASRMESTGKALHIHTSSAFNDSLQEHHVTFMTVERGLISVKGKGYQRTFWLVGKKGYKKPLPDCMIQLQMNVDEDLGPRAASVNSMGHGLFDAMYSAVLRKTSVSVSNYSETSDIGSDVTNNDTQSPEGIFSDRLSLPERNVAEGRRHSLPDRDPNYMKLPPLAPKVDQSKEAHTQKPMLNGTAAKVIFLEDKAEIPRIEIS